MKSPSIAIPLFMLEEKIEKAMRATRDLNYIDKMFLIIPVPKNNEGEDFVETKYGRLRVFFCSELMEFHKYEVSTPKALLLSHEKFEYPKVSKVSTRLQRMLNI